MPRTRPRQRPVIRGWIIAGLALFLAFDAVLVVFALAATAPGPRQEANTIAPFTRPSRTPSPTPSPEPHFIAAPRFLAAVNDQVAWRATEGSCGGPDAVIERTEDGGATWSQLSTAKHQVHQVMALLDPGVAIASVVGMAGADCTLGYFSSFTRGQFWEPYPQYLGGASYLDSSDSGTVHVASATATAPCADVLQLSVVDGIAAVLCTDTLFERRGEGWVEVPVPGILAFTPTETGYTVAISSASGCPGVAIASLASPLTTGSAPVTVGCAASVVAPDAVTLSQSAGSLWLWSGDNVVISTDSGISWP